MVIFHSYVSLPEGIQQDSINNTWDILLIVGVPSK